MGPFIGLFQLLVDSVVLEKRSTQAARRRVDISEARSFIQEWFIKMRETFVAAPFEIVVGIQDDIHDINRLAQSIGPRCNVIAAAKGNRTPIWLNDLRRCRKSLERSRSLDNLAPRHSEDRLDVSYFLVVNSEEIV